MLVREAAENPCAVLAGGNRTAEPHLGEMLRHRGVRLVDDRGELVDAQFAVAECQNDADPGGIRERRKHLDVEFDAPTIRKAAETRAVYIHAQILRHGC